MINGKFLFLLSLILVSAIRTEALAEEDGVLVLTDENFDEAVKTYDPILVEFYAPWCGHCQKLAPEYSRAAKTLRSDNPPIYLAKVDSTVHKKASERFKVEGFPTLKLLIGGNPTEYGGGRDEASIVSWMRKKTGPATRPLTTTQDVDAFKASGDAVLVLFGNDEAAVSLYNRIARSYDDVQFGHCTSDECASHFNTSNGSVVLFKSFDEGRNDLAAGFTEDSLKTFVDSHSSPLIMKFDEKCAQLIFGKSTPGLFLYRDPNSENSKELEAIFTEVANQTKGKLKAVLTGITEGLETRLAEYIGVGAADLPSVRIHDTRVDLKKYNMSGPITVESILAFVADWENGRLRPHLKSEEIPTEQKEAVFTLVGKAFNDIVMDPTKDVLVEFYAPWCGHCKKIAPIYEELAQKLKHNTNLIIAKMDATANEVETVSIQGFPTIKFWPANKKDSPMDFDGDRTVEGFTKFLEKNSGNQFVAKEDL